MDTKAHWLLEHRRLRSTRQTNTAVAVDGAHRAGAWPALRPLPPLPSESKVTLPCLVSGGRTEGGRRAGAAPAALAQLPHA